MSCLGVLFAIDEEQAAELQRLPRKNRVAYIQEEIEEMYFAERTDDLAELDKSWDAMHRLLTDGDLLFSNSREPLTGVILGGEVLYGDFLDEDDYIITYKTPQRVQQIAAAVMELSEAEFRQRYFALDEAAYGFPVNEEDCQYTWEWFAASRPFWRRAAENGYGVLFTVDQ